MVQWTAQRLGAASAEPLGADAARSPPAEWEAVLRRLGVEPSCWCQVVEHFVDWFHRGVGHVDHLAPRVERAGKKWLQGIRACRDAFT